MGFDFSGNQISDNNSPGLPIDDHYIEHFTAGKYGNLAVCNLSHQCAVSPQKKLLTGLASGIKGSGNLGPPKGPACKQPAVFPGKGHTLGHTLVDNIIAHLGQTVDIGLSGSEITAFDGVVKKTPDTVAFIGIILGRIDTPLGCNAVGAPRAVLDTKVFNVIAEFGQ